MTRDEPFVYYSLVREFHGVFLLLRLREGDIWSDSFSPLARSTLGVLLYYPLRASTGSGHPAIFGMEPHLLAICRRNAWSILTFKLLCGTTSFCNLVRKFAKYPNLQSLA